MAEHTGFQKLTQKTLNSLKTFLKIIINLGLLFGFFYVFRWFGLKGMVGFITGLAMMAVIILKYYYVIEGLLKFAGMYSEGIQANMKAYREEEVVNENS